MTCEEAAAWLVAAETPGEAPSNVERHMLECSACRRLQQRIVSIEQNIDQLPRAMDTSDTKSRFVRRLEGSTAPVPAMFAATSPSSRRSRRSWAIIAAAALLLAVGVAWLLSPLRPPHSVVQTGSLPADSSRIDPAVAGRVLQHDLRLAEASTPRDQFQALADMAADLHGETLRLSKLGATNERDMVGGLYQQLVREGLVGRAKAIPGLPDKEIATRLAAELEQVNATPAKAPSKPPSGFLATLVTNGLKLAQADDPLSRADYCSDIADQLVETILNASHEGNKEQTAQLGKHLGDVMERGVAGNLARVSLAGADKDRVADFERVSQRAVGASKSLERNLERAPDAAKAGLERALAASSHGREKAMQASKGKGKGRPGADDKSTNPAGKEVPGKGKAFPPGLEKKQNRDSNGQARGKPD
jgi:hypothetical protein